MRKVWLDVVAVIVAVGAVAIAGIAVWVALDVRSAQSAIVPQVQQVLDEASATEQPEKLLQLEDELTALQAKVAVLESSVAATPKSNPVFKANQAVTSNQVKEFFVYLGTGNTTNREWSDINSTLATIDTSQYRTIKAVTLEATLSILSGEVYARLKNVTTGGIFYPSSVSHNTSTSQWKTSQTFFLPEGVNQYVVQLRSSNGERAQLDGSRLKIVVE